ncbi:hypothetical protein L195_g036790 [Trifolium pratense]|uniref:RRM domain-containing protein n=1 Tax=Trifolium pratense TaxID=57577 RepID=A0A2K3LQI6_TRIPR|nr:hypothetical protein L195_g036790 [Trifolium pratense]
MKKHEFSNLSDSIYQMSPNSIDPVSGRKICACGRYCVDFNSAGYSENFLLNPKQRFLTAIPGIYITAEIGDKADFGKLFEPFGEVKSVTLAPINLRKGTRRGGFGFVTFVNKEDAQQAMDTLNVSEKTRVNIH